jgi:hypothetical protein
MLELKCNLKFLTEDEATEITPVMAQELLDNSRCIKPLRINDVDRLVGEFNNDNFEFNGATITLDANGHLIDGQTRLSACIKANKSFKTFIVHGVTLEGQYTKDTGRSRNVVQYLGTHGYKYPRALSSSAQIIHNIILASDDDTKDGIIEYNKITATHQEIMNIIESEPNLQECVNRIFPEKSRYMTSAIYHLIVLDYLHRYIANSPDMADEFLDILSGKRIAVMDHPVTRLRAAFINNIQRTSTKLKPSKQTMYMIRAYNLLREGKSCKGLKVSKFTPRLDILSYPNKTEGDL